MASWAPARADAPPLRQRAPTRPRGVRTPARERRLAGGVLWIGLLALLLTGVVALNVAVLRLNMEIEKLGRERIELRAKNAELASRLSSSAAPARVDSLARRQGLVLAQPTYVDLRSR